MRYLHSDQKMNNQASSRSEESISISDIARAMAPIKWTLLVGALCGAVIGLGSSWLFTPIYQATTTMLPTKSPESSNGLGGVASQVGGLAALAGINIQSNDSQVASSEYLKSNTLAAQFIASHEMLPMLFPDKWDARRGEWIPSRSGPPTASAGVRKFHSRAVKISEDKRTSLLTLTFDWPDPSLAYRWANEFVSMANNGLRSRAILDAKNTISYLNGEIDKTQSIQVKESLYKIVETQYRTLALANSKEDYAFRVVDAAVMPDPEDKVSPKRALFGLLGLIVGAIIFGAIRSRSLKKGSPS
jgi:uncharacterized protein involved in exopolysaccharide biosynthesis